MTYDQAQSPRLGQPVPVESTFVRSFDIDPATPGPDLLEAAWHGMLIFRSDLSILQIYDGPTRSWRDIAGGIAGAATYVATERPWPDGDPAHAGVNIGDLWVDSDDGMKPYVWDGAVWAPTKGGGGVLTFRQPSAPTATNIGDIWIDSDDGEKMYRWGNNDATPPVLSWVLVQDHGIPAAQATADRKTRAYYLPGLDNTVDPPTFSPPIEAPDHTPLTVGDVWFQTDGDPINRPWWWTGSAWVDAGDPNLALFKQQVLNNIQTINGINTQIENLYLTGSSTNNTADTADGRISTSDYRPGPDDLKYIQYRQQLDMTDPNNPVATTVEYLVDRVEGSIWFTQTRPRINYCTNPSFEVDTESWSTDYCAIERFPSPDVPSGDYTCEVTNSAGGDHVVSWGNPGPGNTPAPAQPNQQWTASLFTELMAGGNGTGVTVQLVWVDANNVVLGIEASAPFDQIVNAWDPEKAGTIAEPRYTVTGTAPALTAGVYVRLFSPQGPNDADVFHMGALLLEQRGDLGRYFDGSSYDGYWLPRWVDPTNPDAPIPPADLHGLGTPHASRSGLYGDKIFQVWELREGDWWRKYLTDTAQTVVDGSVIVGAIDGELIADNTLTAEKQYAALVKASESLQYGDLVNVYNDLGIFNVRKADASLGKNYEAHGFVLNSCTIGQNIRVYHQGTFTWPTTHGYTPGTQWLSTTAGQSTRKPPSSNGVLIQQVGFAPSGDIFNFQPRLAIKLS